MFTGYLKPGWLARQLRSNSIDYSDDALTREQRQIAAQRLRDRADELELKERQMNDPEEKYNLEAGEAAYLAFHKALVGEDEARPLMAFEDLTTAEKCAWNAAAQAPVKQPLTNYPPKEGAATLEP